MPPTRIPKEEDFASILPSHPTYGPTGTSPISLVYPSPPESTTALMLLFHGLGDSEVPFTSFARNLSLPNVLAIAVRGLSPLPALFLPNPNSQQPQQQQAYHWGDDLTFTPDSSSRSSSNNPTAIDPDPGFTLARSWITDKLIGEVLVGKCGWETRDILLFGFGQGGSVALGLGSWLRGGTGTGTSTGSGSGSGSGSAAFKGIVSLAGPLPPSMIPSASPSPSPSSTPVLVLCSRDSEAFGEDEEELLREQFSEVKVVRWKRAGDGMPRDREEAMPMMQFLAQRLRGGWL